MFLTNIRDLLDIVFEPAIKIAIQNRKVIRCLSAIIILASFMMFFNASFQKLSGKLAWFLLLIILFLSPIAKITLSKTFSSLMLFRRELGILMGVFAIEHGIAFFYKMKIDVDFVFKKNFWLTENNITPFGWGMLALLATVPLLATSNNFSMQLLKNNWKKLHRAAYLILFFAALHIALIKYDFLQVILIILMYIILKTLAVIGFQLPNTLTKNIEAL